MFGGISLLGLLLSFGIRGEKLEASEDWDEEQGSGDEEDRDEHEDGENRAGTPTEDGDSRRPLIERRGK